ncbi:TonB-dependent receptor domain-containing protein [Myroides sp. LJL115]
MYLLFKYIPKIFIYIVIGLYSLGLTAQKVSLKGKVIDTKSDPMEFLSVSLVQKDNTIAQTLFTDEQGEFHFLVDPATYDLVIRQFEKPYFTKNIVLSQHLILDNIQIDDSQLLQEISITAQKKLIEKKVDRLIYNVENSIVSSGTDALEVIRSTPKIDVTQSDIKIIGKSSVGILINGKKIDLTGVDLENYLRSIRSENIKSIEVITTPGAKYDAQGNAGLLNIVLKKQSFNSGFNGSASFSYTQRKKISYSPSIGLNYSSKKFSVDVGFSYNQEHKQPIGDSSIEFENAHREFTYNRSDKSTGSSANVQMQYNLKDNQKMGLSYRGSFWDSRFNTNNWAYYSSESKLDSLQNSPSVNKEKYDFHTLSAFYDIELDEEGKKIAFNANYLTKNNNSNQDISNITYWDINQVDILNSSKVNNFTSTNFDVFTLSTDVNLPLDAFDISFGAKYTHATTKNRSEFKELLSVEQLPFDSLKDKFNYQEQIFAGYFSIEKEFDNGIIAQIGLRYEHTYNKRESVYLKQLTKKSFDNLFPSVFVSYDPSDDHSFSLAYSKRIERPSFSQLNPYRTYSNYNSYIAGNPYLQASISHNIEFTYVFRDNLYFTLYDSYLKKAQDYITIAQQQTNEIISIPENFFNQNTIGLDIGYNFKPLDWFNSYNSGSLYLNYSKSYLPDVTNLKQQGAGYYLSTRNSFAIYKPKDLYLLINFFQDFPTTEGFTKFKTRASFDLGVRLQLLSKKLSLNASYMDVFRQNRNSGYENYPSYSYRTAVYNDIRKFNLTLTYLFGKQKKKIKERPIEEESRI